MEVKVLEPVSGGVLVFVGVVKEVEDLRGLAEGWGREIHCETQRGR